MADGTDHVAKTKSLAYLAEAGKVSGFQMPNQEHVSKNPSDLQQVYDAQLVSTNKDNYKGIDEEQPDLQSGPAKKYIDNPDQSQPSSQQQQQSQPQTQAVPLSNYAADNMPSQGNNGGVDSFVPTTDDQDKQNYDAFFGDVPNTNDQSQANDVNNTNNNNNTDDMFGGLEVNNDDNVNNQNGTNEIPQANDDMFGGMDNNNNVEEEKEPEQKQTFLSVWQEQHREQLAKKAKEEREAQEKKIATAKKELEEFNEKRRERIEQQRKDAKGRESDLKEDYNSVFQHGTIWQQVAKLVDLQSKNKDTERMRDLLIVLKNADEKKSDQ